MLGGDGFDTGKINGIFKQITSKERLCCAFLKCVFIKWLENEVGLDYANINFIKRKWQIVVRCVPRTILVLNFYR